MWLLRILLFAITLSFCLHIYPISLNPLEIRGVVAGTLLAGIGFVLEALGRRLDIRVLLGGMIGVVCGAGVGAVLSGLIPAEGLLGVPAQLLRASSLVVAVYAGAVLGGIKAEGFTLESLRAAAVGQPGSASSKILDTSVIIDGRIADVCETGFLDGKLVVPQFVLNELQYIADSADSLKRNRGRKGLEILQRIQKGVHVKVEIVQTDFPEVKEVDLKLIELARRTAAKIITNDFNLNKVAQLRGVEVLNINELANSLKPVVLPGESMKLFILKEGKETNQGVGYLDDGTMVVVDNAKRSIGRTVDIIITSVLQTTAGKMFFGRFEHPNAGTGEEVDQMRRNG